MSECTCDSAGPARCGRHGPAPVPVELSRQEVALIMRGLNILDEHGEMSDTEVAVGAGLSYKLGFAVGTQIRDEELWS